MSTLRSGFITDKDLEDYRRDGAIVVRNVVGMDWVERTREAAALAVEIRLKMDEAQGKPRPTGPAFHNVLFMHRFNEDFRAIALDSPIASVARDVMQSQKVILLGDHLLVKEPGTQEKTPWHHDLPYWPVRGEQVTSAWLALDPVTRENGSMEYVAGSHLWGRTFQPQNFEASGALTGLGDFEPMPDIDGHREDYRILQWDLEPGDMLIHNPLVLHGAGVNNRKDRNRRGLAIRYVGEQARWHELESMKAGKGPPGIPLPDLREGDPLDKNGAYMVADLAQSPA